MHIIKVNEAIADAFEQKLKELDVEYSRSACSFELPGLPNSLGFEVGRAYQIILQNYKNEQVQKKG